MADLTQIDLEREKLDILNAYRGLLRVHRSRNREDTRLIRKAFNVAVEAHKDMRRKSGEPYIFHPIAVARITAEEIGLGTTSIVCGLLHDTVEDTEITLEDIERMFGPKVAMIIDGLTKISGVFDQTSSLQAENFRKMLLTLSDDVRVILIKLADRLHNMRTLDSMRRDKQLKIASETLYLYAPLAHRLGLYSIKSELEDLSLKFKEPDVYADLTTKLIKGQAVRARFVSRFTHPLKTSLQELGYDFEIKGRPKSVFSIWNKMRKKNIPFEEVYDLFAIRIILNVPEEGEKSECWKVYSVVTDFYKPNPDRLRDWISTPKGNGYESLHTTVMSPTGKWVEVQIRSLRMDEIAEKGYAAHWKYKESKRVDRRGANLDQWLNRIREMLEFQDGDSAIEFIDDFKLNLFADEIFIFTPKGELKTLPASATALDFAFDIHTQVGENCLGAKVNHKLVPLSHELKSGDQVEIITSNKQKPKEDWLNFVVTHKAKSKIKSALKEERKKIAADGKEMLRRKFRNLKIDFNGENVSELVNYYKTNTALDLYFRIAKGVVDLKKLSREKHYRTEKGFLHLRTPKTTKTEVAPQIITEIKGKGDTLLIGDDLQKLDYKLAPCCNPIAGDEVFGFVTIGDGIKIHRQGCPNATRLLSNFAYRVVKARWISQALKEFQTSIRFEGIDDIGLVNKITSVISDQQHLNMKAISFESNDGVFTGEVKVLVYDADHLDQLIQKLLDVDGVNRVERIAAENQGESA